MSTQGNTSLLTSKFSRSSLKKATGQTKVYNREEELQKATNKRFNSESWRNVSKNYRAFPSSNGGVGANNSFSNTQVLYTMSSLTNDEAFRHNNNDASSLRSGGPPITTTSPNQLKKQQAGKSLLTRSAKYSGKDAPISKLRRPPTPYARYDPAAASDRSERTSDTPDMAMESSFSNSSRDRFGGRGFEDDRDDFQDCQVNDETSPSRDEMGPMDELMGPMDEAVNVTPPAVSSTAAPTRALPQTVKRPAAPTAQSKPMMDKSQAQPSPSSNGPSLRNAAVGSGRRPRLNRTLSGRTLPNHPMLRRPTSTSKMSTSEKSQSLHKSLKRSKGIMGSLKSVLGFFASIFKFIHYIFLLPKTLQQACTGRRWTAKGKNILITGASSGIGAELARQYAAQGARLALIARTEKDLERVQHECQELGSSKVLYYTADLSNPVSTKLVMKQAMKDFYQFDVVVLNAGRNQGCYFEEIKDVTQIENMIKLNVNGAITCLHYALPKIPKTKDSRIVFISNTAGIVAAPYQSVYSATKHALTGFSSSLRMELHNTYAADSPKVCLVTLPEVSGTRGNTNRLDMGAKLPPAKWYSWAGLPLPQAVHNLIPAVAAGKREYGQPMRYTFWQSIYALFPSFVDKKVMQHINKTHYRPLDEAVSGKKSKKETLSDECSQAKPPPNKSWAC